MSSNQHDDLKNLRFDILNTDLDLGMTFVGVAKTEQSIDPAHSDRALAKALIALQSVRYFLAKPGLSPEQVELLADRCRALENAIEQVSSQA